MKTVKGFTYLPRQDGGTNGDIKKYSVYLSLDGKEWGEPIAEGIFKKDKSVKKTLLDKPVKARYIRFTGLSSQNGADFAGGAEFTVIAE